MTRVFSKMNLLFLFSIYFVIVNCEKQRDDNYGLGNPDFGPFPVVKNEGMMEPNFFQKIGSHIVKGWHGFRGLFGRKSNRREENIYGNGGFGREEKQKPYEKETNLNKEYPESNYNNNNNYGNSEYNQNQFQQGGQKGNQEGNQGFQVGVDERFKGDAQKLHKEDKNLELEESSGKPFDQRKDDRKNKAYDKKSPETVNNNNNNNNGNNNFETELGNQNIPGGKQRSRRDLRGRLPFRQPFRPPFRQPFRKPFRSPFRLPIRRPF